MKSIIFAGATAIALSFFASPALSFDVSFTWEGLKLCNTGHPNRVANPVFTLKNVPEGTKYLRFKLIDLDVPNYNHGDGVVKYSGQTSIARGAFKYKSPCPPKDPSLPMECDGADQEKWWQNRDNAQFL